MLGHVVSRVFRDSGFDIRTVSGRFCSAGEGRYSDAILETKSAYCINCIGIGPGRGATADQFRAANSDLPEMLAQTIASRIPIIHASTDGVFAAGVPDRRADEAPDAEDDYGLTKRRAEIALRATNAHIIRCSIIGPETSGARSLLQWALSQTGTIRGFTNHMWNGITTLQWARLALEVVAHGDTTPNLMQPGFLPAISKYELLQFINEAWGRGLTIEPTQNPTPVARTLVPNVLTPSIQSQLRELKEWYYRVPA